MIPYVDEYKTLRDEILQGKKWVFERPLLIITISIALIKLLEAPLIYFIPTLMMALLLFNLWFTVNRIKSIARIVAYIQLVLEGDEPRQPVGWESSLRYYRKWMKMNEKKLESILEKDMDQEAVPDAIGYYPVLYYLHIGMVAFIFASSLLYSWMHPSVLQILTLVLSLLFFFSFMMYCIACQPSKTGRLIEENRIIWRRVLADVNNSTPMAKTATPVAVTNQ